MLRVTIELDEEESRKLENSMQRLGVKTVKELFIKMLEIEEAIMLLEKSGMRHISPW